MVESILAAVYTARYASHEAPTVVEVCQVSGCSLGQVHSVLARRPAVAVKVGLERIRLSGHGKALILRASGRGPCG